MPTWNIKVKKKWKFTPASDCVSDARINIENLFTGRGHGNRNTDRTRYYVVIKIGAIQMRTGRPDRSHTKLQPYWLHHLLSSITTMMMTMITWNVCIRIYILYSTPGARYRLIYSIERHNCKSDFQLNELVICEYYKSCLFIARYILLRCADGGGGGGEGGAECAKHNMHNYSE